jgi:hypothetical protein
LKKVFQNVIILPGEKNYFLASDGTLTYAIAKEVQDKKIENRYVNQFYIDDSLLKMRGETILSAIIADSEINQNLKPVLYRQQLAYWLSYFTGKYWIMAVIALALTLFIFFRGSSSSQAMLITGFSASGLEILLLLGLQVFFGNIYLLTSFIITGFMLGLAIGTFYGISFKSAPGKEYISITQIVIAIFSAVAGLFLFSSKMAEFAPTIVYALYLISVVLIGGLTGFQFTQVSMQRNGSYAEISGSTYSYDLIGSALGALSVALFLVPNLGIFASALSICLVNLIFGIWLILNKISRI